MAGFCLPKELTSKFLGALKEGTLDPVKLSEMDSAGRHAEFSKVIGEGNAREVNALFESKLLLKNQQAGFITWARSVGGLTTPAMRDFVTRLSKMDKVLNPADQQAFLADLAAKKIGMDVSLDEVRQITELSNKAQAAKNAPTKNLSGVSDDYIKAAADLRGYIASLKPTSAIASIGKNAAVIARNNLLLNPSTPIKTTIGQIVNTAMDFASRRIGSLSIRGSNYGLVRQANAEAWTTFRKTGMNTASMESIDDVGKLGEGTRFEPNSGMNSSNRVVSAIETGVRNIAKISNKIAIDWEHNFTFTKFYQKAFFDMNNILSTNIAKTEGLSGAEAKVRASEIFKDAARIKPQTEAGAAVRTESQKQAARVTSTNDTYTARLALGVKDALNRTITGLGDALMPIAKIPANIIWNGIENAGVGIPLGVKDIFQGRMKIQSPNLATRYEGMAQFSSGIQKVARTVGVLGMAAYFSSQLTKDDFRTDAYGNHFVKIGDVWINMEYVNAVSPALAGMMGVKANAKPDQGTLETAGQYTAGALQGLKGAPGIDEVSQLITSMTNANYAKGIQKYANNFFTSRGEPAFIKNLLNNRPIERLFWGATGVETTDEVKADNVAKAKAAAAARKK